jgi:hypothetical protein
MKILAMVTMAATATAWAGETGAALERKVAVYMDPNGYGMEIRAAQRLASKTTGQKITVYLRNEASVPSPILARARTLASEMFAGVGVQIDWRPGQRADSELLRERAIAVCLTLDTSSELRTTVGAFATPSEGLHITVLYQHLAWSLAKPGLAPALLAHVLVHEITHLLEGIARHSESGIMKANWTSSDYYDMQTKTLPFASEDVELIHLGLAQRRPGNGKINFEK